MATPIDPNADNGVNPLNALDFDINSLIPQKEFNWDTVEGIDSINNSVMRAYGNVTSDLSKRIDTLATKVAANDCAITDSLGRCLDNLSVNVDNIGSGIADNLCKRADGLCDTYGNGVGEVKWWIIYRQCEDGLYHPFLETATSPPVGYESYGPFIDCSPFRIDMSKTLAVIPPKQESGPSQDQDLQMRILGLYQEQLSYLKNVLYPGYQEGQGEDGSGMCGPLSDCNAVIAPNINPPSGKNPANKLPSVYPEGMVPSLSCPPGVKCSSLGYDKDGYPFYIDADTGVVHYDISITWIPNENNTTPNIQFPISEPNQEGSHPAVSIPEQQTLPTYPPNSTITSPPSDNGDNLPYPVSSCPAPIVQNVVNVAPCSSGAGGTSDGTINVQGTDLTQLIDAIRSCCDKLTKGATADIDGVASDIEYIYSDSGQARIDSVLLAQGLQSYDQQLPSTIGVALKDLMTLALREV